MLAPVSSRLCRCFKVSLPLGGSTTFSSPSKSRDPAMTGVASSWFAVAWKLFAQSVEMPSTSFAWSIAALALRVCLAVNVDFAVHLPRVTVLLQTARMAVLEYVIAIFPS